MREDNKKTDIDNYYTAEQEARSLGKLEAAETIKTYRENRN